VGATFEPIGGFRWNFVWVMALNIVSLCRESRHISFSFYTLASFSCSLIHIQEQEAYSWFLNMKGFPVLLPEDCHHQTRTMLGILKSKVCLP
jgi:hypothetical protein